MFGFLKKIFKLNNPYYGDRICPRCLFRFSKKIDTIDLPNHQKYLKISYFKCPLCGHEFIVRYKKKEYVEKERRKIMLEDILS